MRVSLAPAIATIVVSGCSHSNNPEDVSAIQGRWSIEEARGLAIPAECKDMGYEITPTAITMHSGELTISASYRAERAGKGFVLRQYSFSDNGRPNCQGRSADYVVSHYIQDLDVDVVGDKLRLYFPNRSSDSYLDFVRSSRK